MIRKFRRIFRSPPTATTIKNEPIHPTSSNTHSNPDPISPNKPRTSSVTNHLYTESPDTNRLSSTDDVQYAKMRIISSPVFQLRDIIHALLTSSSPSCDLISTFLTYGQSLGASSIHGYLVDRCYETQTLINDEFSSYQGVALCVTYDVKLSEQQWEDIFGIHESTSITAKNTSSFFHLTDFLCVLSGSRVVYYDPNERMTNDERAYVSIFDLENDDIGMFQDQFSPLDYFLLQSKTYYNGTLIRLPLRTTLKNQMSSEIQTLDDIKQQILRYFSSNQSLIELLLTQTKINTIEFDYTKDFQLLTRFLSIEKQFLSMIHDAQSTTQVLQLNISKLIKEINQSDVTRWLFSIHNEIESSTTEFKLLLPLIPLSFSSDPPPQSYNYQSIPITSSRILYYHIPKLLHSSSHEDLGAQLRQRKFPQAYAIFLKDLSRLIKPTTSANLSMELIWQLMPDIDEQQNIPMMNNIIPDIWGEIGKQELFYSVTEGWGFVAIEDMIINNVPSGPIQDVLTYVFSEANAPIVILPGHVINGLCKYSNKHYLQVMTPFHASELLAKNSSLLSRLTTEQKLSLLKYIIFNDPDPGLVLELDLLPLANNTFTTFQTKQAPMIYIIENNDAEFLKLFPSKQYERFLSTNLDENLFEKLSGQNFQDRTQLQSMPAKDFADLVMLPREWRRGDDCIQWPRNHDYYNIPWLENLWKYIHEKCPNDLTILENTNILYLQPLSRPLGVSTANNTIALYKLSKNIGLIQLPIVPSKDDLAIQKVLLKLNFHCIEPFPEIIRRHKLIDEYVPQLSCIGLLQILKCRLRHFTQLKIQHEFNTLLNEHDIKLFRQYLSRILTPQLDDSNIQCIKQLPIFDNAYLNQDSHHSQQQYYKYISLNNILYIYESGTKLPIDLQPPKQCIHVTDSDSRILLDKLGYVIHDFTHVVRYLITTIGQQQQQQQQQLLLQQQQSNSTNITSKIDQQKMIFLGRWLLTNCPNLILTDAVGQDTLSTCRLFLNRKNELCSCQQMFDPSSFTHNNKEKYLILFESKYLPSLELSSQTEHLTLLKHLKLKQFYDIKCDELIDICELTIKESSVTTTNRRSLMLLLADFIVDILNQNSKLIDEYSQTKRISLKQYLNITQWIPVMIERPHGYPSTLTWQGSIDTRRSFVTPREVCDKTQGFLVGATALVSSLDLPESFSSKSRSTITNRFVIDLREIKLDLLIKQLKCLVLCYQKSSSHEQKNETFDYLNLSKRLYETLTHLNNPTDILKEMRICDVNEWIWNGTNGFSSINHIYLLDKIHPLASYVPILPYELYNYRKFFDSMGVKYQPESSKVEELFRTQQISDENLFKWIKETYTNDRRLLQLINDLELKSVPKGPNKTKNLTDDQTRITFSSTLDLSDDKVYLYLPDIFNKQTNIKETVVQALTIISKEKKTQLLTEEDYFIRKMSGSEYQKNLYDYYRAYNDLLLPNLNVLPKNVKDTLVLFALDNADNTMLSILKQHCCIPCTPNGRTLNKPSKLIHPYCRLASLYSDIDSLFPYGGQDSYLREDRLNVLKLLGMKCDDNLVTWPELVERCESIQRMRDYDLARERSLALLQILNDMLSMSNSNPTRTFDENDESTAAVVDRRSRQSTSMSRDKSTNNNNNNNTSSSILNTHEALHDKEARTRASLQLRELAFIPIKSRPHELTGINLTWMGDRYSNRLFKPKDVLSQHYEQLICSTWPIAEQTKSSQEQIIITKQVEHFLALDDTTKIELKDILKQLDEISKLSILNHAGSTTYNHQTTSKYILDMSYAIYDYIQSFCFPHLQKSTEQLWEYRSANMNSTQLETIIRDIREFFTQRRFIFFTDPSSPDGYLFLSLSQLLWQPPNRSSSVNHLKPYYYPIPISLQKYYKHFFLDLLKIKVQLDGKDLLNIIEQIRKKYSTKPIDKDDFTLLQNIYTLLIEQYANIFNTNIQLYLPNVDCVLQPGSKLYFYPFEREQILPTSSPSAQDEQYVHPSIDRRVCVKAGVKTRKTPTVTATVTSTSPTNHNEPVNTMNNNSNNSSRLFPKNFGNKKLESILARLDDPHINPQLVETMDESNPNIVLEFLLESNKYTEITTNLSDDDIIIILRYFNDFLTKGFQGNFQKLRELKIYKPLWGIASTDDKQQQHPVHQCCSLENFAHVYILNEDWSNLIRRSFKRNFFTEQFHEKKMVLLMQKKIDYLSKIFTHIRFILPSDMEIFLQLCLPYFRKLDVKSQVNLLKYFTDDIDEKLFQHEKEQCRKQLHDHLEIFTQTSNDYAQKSSGGISRSSRDPPEICPIYELYDPNIKNIRSILGVHHFPDEQFHTPTMMKFLKECGLRSYIPTDKCKQIMEAIQLNVKQEGWTNELRKRSKCLYEHLLIHWTRYDNSILDYQFLEPYQMRLETDHLAQLHEQYTNTHDTPIVEHLRHTCIKLHDGELVKDAKLCWTSSYLLPDFVRLEQYNDLNDQQEPIEQNAIDFFKLNKKPSYALVQKHLSNLAKKFSLKYHKLNDLKPSSTPIPSQDLDEILIAVLKIIYHYFQTEIKIERRTEIYKELEDRECIYSRTRRQFLPGKYFCLNLPIADEIPPFLFSLDQDFHDYKEFFLHIGVQAEPHPMLYGDILRKLSKVCEQDYLNSNELCKSLKAMECFFKYLTNNSTINSQTKLPGLYLVTNDFKLVKSNDIVIMDDKTKLDYMTKLVHDKFMFNPNERVLKLDPSLSSTNSKSHSSMMSVKDLIEKIFISQRPILFTQKYEESFSITIPEDGESHRQRFLNNLERKYNQLLSSRHLHRCMARVIANHVARQHNPKIISMDDVENLIRQRLTFVKVNCVEYLETNLVYRKTQQKVDQSVDEKAVYLVAEGEENIMLYISMKHTEQPYFTLCLARALSPCLGLSELQLDNSVMAALLATTIGQMSKFLNLVNIASEENILSTLKLQYIPSPGNVYGDDIEQLQQFNVEQHQILPGDLCVYRDNDLYIYCEVEKILKEYPNHFNNDQWSWKKSNTSSSSSSLVPAYIFICRVNDAKETRKIEAANFYVLEHWSRIFDAVHTKPVDERESYKSSSASSSTTNSQGKNVNGDKEKNTDEKHSSSSRRPGKSTNESTDSPSDAGHTNGFDHSKTYRQTSADSDSSSNTTSESQSESESAQANEQDIIDKTELELTKTEIYTAVRQAFQLTGQERKKTVKKLLLKWHPDKNPGRERFAAEVFKHLRKQIDHFENDPLTSFFNTFNNFHHSPFSASDPKFSWNKHSTTNKTNHTQSASSATTDDRFGSYDNLNKETNNDAKRSYQDIPNGDTKDQTDQNDPNGNSSKSRFSPHRSSSFRTAREEWQYRRQHGFQRRHGFFSPTEENTTNGNTNGSNAQTSSSTGGKESPNARRKRNYQQSEADRWLKQAQHDLESAYSDMHSSTGQVAYDWACYKCYRSAEKALKAYHYYKDTGKNMTADIPGLLIGVDNDVREIGYKLYKWIGDPNRMQYPNAARFAKIPAEVFTVSQAEQAIEYTKELLKKIEDIMYP